MSPKAIRGRTSKKGECGEWEEYLIQQEYVFRKRITW